MPEADMYDSAEIELDELSFSPRRKGTRWPRYSGSHFPQGRPWRNILKRRAQPWSLVWWIALLCLVSFASPAAAVLLDFENCLSKTILESDPLQLQFVPTNVSVKFNLTNPLHPLAITVYGNVSGTVSRTANYPAPGSPVWGDANWTDGKIEDVSSTNNRYSTLMTDLNVLSFTPFHNASRFRDSLTQGTLPLGPVFNYNLSDLTTLQAFSVQHDMLSTYRFGTITPLLTIRSGDASAVQLACVSVKATPDFGTSLKNAIAYVPLVILILVGIATIAAAMYSPWGTTDLFRWTSNYGRDEDILRLVTPGFADCLQYLQFVVLTGSLSLDYPGFFQPAVSQGAWSTLMFNHSFLSTEMGRDPVVDGLYAINGTYGLDRLNQLVGMASSQDIWPGMMIWVLIILASVTVLFQIAFALRWLYRELANNTDQDLRARNMPFTIGNLIRIVFNFLLLPIVSFSFFQLVLARQSPAYCVALAAVVLVLLACFSIWVIRVILSTRPKSHLFDDLPTVLLYGPLYNTYCDDAAAFGIVPIVLNIARGIAIGALQPSGIAQVVMLAICEVVSVLTLLAFRPFSGPTHMNLYHCLFSIVRFLTVILSVIFVPSLTVGDAARGWIGYLILVLHAVVLVFGFFLNAMQTLIEVLARLAGAGGATRGGLTKVLGMRQLSRRTPRRDLTRQSMGSEAAMLGHGDDRMSSQFDGSRPRSLSGSSGLLLNRATASDGRASAGYDYASSQGGTHSRAPSGGFPTPTSTAYQGAGFPTSPSSGTMMGMHPRDPYYRPPRPGRKSPQATGSLEKGKSPSRGFLKSRSSRRVVNTEDDMGDGTMSGRATPVPAYLAAPKDDLELDTPRKPKDYAVREVDFYYGVRGPPLSHSGTRKLKTGPADPTGPVSSATGWFRSLLQGKTKDNAKGFEVVRSARAPPPGLFPPGGDYNDQYQDDPGTPSASHSRNVSNDNAPYVDSDNDHDPDRPSETRPPVLPQLNTSVGGGIELPSRTGSRHTQAVGEKNADGAALGLPVVTETLSHDSIVGQHSEHSEHHLQPEGPTAARLPFSGSSSPSRERGLSMTSTSRSRSNASSHQTGPRAERPSSMGYVPQYRAHDQIHEASPDEPSFAGSSAELVDEAALGKHER
ncbi:TRP-like family [Penicillium robsamsonii]|uniref:TRP-like family n=1 Tax=Penicillium robsamsonii TaxID=1792511 RepID=UPI0025470566|nr:TRP-like family [Penicillium robsamsonii]KAJ5807649.1 TRP-like family [Penicillium robsamsonii]